MFFSVCSPISSKVEIEPVADMIADGLGDRLRRRRGDALQARRHVDAVAKNVFAFDDDVAKVDADAKFDAPILRHVDISSSACLAEFRRRTRPRSPRSGNSTSMPSPVSLTMRP